MHDLVERLTGVARQDLVVALDQVLPFLHLDDRVRGVAAEPARALVDHDPAVRQGVALAVRAGRQQDRGHRRRHADADRADRRPQVLHGVVDREAGRDLAAGRVDVQADVLLRVLGLEEQELGDHQVGEVVLDRVTQEDDPLAQQPRVDVVGALPPAGGLDDHGHEHAWTPSFSGHGPAVQPAAAGTSSRMEPGSVASTAALAVACSPSMADASASSRCGSAG